jgi:molybdopterin-binding protein
MAKVRIDIGNGNVLILLVTMNALDDVALRGGDSLTAVIKASSIGLENVRS